MAQMPGNKNDIEGYENVQEDNIFDNIFARITSLKDVIDDYHDGKLSKEFLRIYIDETTGNITKNMNILKQIEGLS